MYYRIWLGSDNSSPHSSSPHSFHPHPSSQFPSLLPPFSDLFVCGDVRLASSPSPAWKIQQRTWSHLQKFPYKSHLSITIMTKFYCLYLPLQNVSSFRRPIWLHSWHIIVQPQNSSRCKCVYDKNFFSKLKTKLHQDSSETTIINYTYFGFELEESFELFDMSCMQLCWSKHGWSI